jgi:riboflavin synthase
MFTGIVSDIGEVISREERGDTLVEIACAYAVDSIAVGGSIACSGICLTVIGSRRLADGRSAFAVQASAETRARTTLGTWRVGTMINLERALRVGDELGGHLVSGHVDAVARITEVVPVGESRTFQFEPPEALAPMLAEKGSVCLDGVSLTVNEVEGRRVGVNIIPHTLAVTTLGAAKQGEFVNLEVDMLARYVARLTEWRR